MKKCYPFDFTKEASHRITIQEKNLFDSDFGDSEILWTDLATVSAIVTPIRQIEKLKYSKLDSSVMHNIIIRYTSDWSAPLTSVERRIMFEGRTLEITQAININEKKDYIEISAQEVQVQE